LPIADCFRFKSPLSVVRCPLSVAIGLRLLSPQSKNPQSAKAREGFTTFQSSEASSLKFIKSNFHKSLVVRKQIVVESAHGSPTFDKSFQTSHRVGLLLYDSL
jgi:hypothetical protein